MAERPLYTLYKNLKAQNYDVPDDYNKFESALTRDGKGGADNRHAIYENLKAQNFDVPSTYERFYSALFEPRSKTSSRAKGGSVPMSAADRARFSAGAAAISASAQQTMNNAGRYNRLKQRKQKQQKDFGRVNLGTHQTPYGGDANNVVKDDFAYNPETGKTGAYVTSDNENVYSLPEAEQMQAILDKQNDAYQVAVDTGEIPSAFDVRDKNGNYDLQENIGKNGTYLTEEGAQKQFDKKLADAYARKKEIEALIAEDNRQHGNPLLSYGASIGASNGRTAEQSDYRNKLATSLSMVTQQIGALEAVKQYPTSSWGEDALKALDNTAFTAKTWDFGLTDFAIMGQMERIKTKMDNNIPLSGSDKMLLKSKLGADAATALEDEKMGNVYRWTKIAGQSLPFMADFFLTGGYGGITKGISRGALKFAAKRGMGKVSAAILKNTGIVAGDVIGSYAMAGTEQALKTGADIMQRHLGNLYQDEKGDYKFGTFDENGNLLHEGGESIGTALYKGMTSAMVENYTEKLFGHNYGIKKGAVNFMEKHGMNASAEFFKNTGKSGWYTNSKKWMEKFGINGFAEEVMEEEIGIPLHALLDGEGKVSDLLDAKQQLDIIGGMAISVGSMYAMGAGSRPVKGIYNRAQYYRFRNKVNVADSDAQNLMGDNWADIKDKIDNATNEQMGGVLSDILRQRDTMTKEQINAAVNYGVNLMKMRGYNIAKTAEMNAKEITNEPTTPEEQHQADIDNAYSEGHDADDADKHDIQIQQEEQMKTLAAALGISEQQLSAMSDEELESLTGQDDKLDQAIYDYQLSSARYKGVVDDAQDKVDLAAHQAEQRVDMYTDQSRGSVRNATIKASGGLEDYGVYIISGNIATHDDGSIDVSNSDDMILYYDPTTNSVEHADALMFDELGEELPADEVKAQAVSDAKENAIKEVAGIIDGTVEVGSQFNVTDTDGTEHTYEVLADYGDGTAAISIDGNVVENPYSLADLQQMKDLEDQKRLEAAKTQREQMEKERAAQQTQETEQTQPSFDFNQILNDNGNVVLVDVLDKDGNTKYPDSRLFLIRDAGAKAKVVELKSDGTLVPHAVNKEDVATISSMSLDEYKQAMPESSMIVDNSGEESDEDSQLENLGLPKGSEIWMSGDGFGRPKENTQSKVVGIDEQGSIILEDKDGKKWSASFDYINNHRELPPLDENTNIVNDENNQSESNAEENTPAPEQTPAMTLEDGTIVPMLEDGNPDFSKLTAAQTAELYDTQFGEDADSIVSGYVSDAKKALDKASNMTVKGKTFVEQKAAKDAKEKAIADAQAAYDSAVAIRDAYNERQLAKVEDTAEGRKELIEKARRKFARLKSAVKDDAEAVSQLYRETIGSLLHRLYDGTGIDVTDTIPLTAEEYVASNLGAHSLNYEGTETSNGVKQETGLSREDFAKTQLLAADGKGTTIDALVHSLWENRPSNLESLDTQDIRNALIGVLNSGFKASEARNFVENIRIAQAENILEEQKRAQENAAYAEQPEAEQEAELKAKSDEKAELKAKSEAKLDNESSNESNDLDNDLDNEETNDKINDNINVPEDATDENPLGAERDESDLPFSAKENGKQQTTAERAADVEKNKVDDMKVVDNIVGEKTRKAFERLAKMMGANIQWQYSDKLGNGWIQETTDADGNVHRTIFITLDSSITEGAQFIFGHEMTHQIKNLNPAAYNELTQLVLDTYGSDAFDKAVDETMQRYSDAGFSGRARDYYAEEVVADAVGEMIRDLNLAHTLAMKMSHPLLAAIHEILQKIKLAFFGTEYSDVTKNIIRSIEQAYVKTANGQVTNSETGEDVSFSLRQKPEPKKKGIGYKVFVLKDGKLYPPMVANPDGAATPVGVWLDADAAPIAGESKTGRPQVKQGGKGTQGGSGKLAYRPGWHLGVVPYAIQFNRKDAEGNKTLFPKNFVFAEVEYAADVDYQEEARQEGINPSGKYQHSLAGLKHLPTDGYYMYRTNPNPETDPWVITGAMKVNRILTRAEQAELVKNAGREPQQIQEGDIVTDDVVNSINQEIADAPKFSLKTYHGTGANFDRFDTSHAYEGAGSETFGHGIYVTKAAKIGASYALKAKVKKIKTPKAFLNYVIFDENNANIVGNTKFSLRYDQFEHDLNQWKKDNNLPKDAKRPTIPQRNAGESAVDFLRRVDEYRKQMALWKTAPTYEQHLLSDDTALGEFNRELQRGSVLKRIAFQDSMLAIRKAQEVIMKEVGVDRLNMAEDAYTAENRSHGKGKNEFEEYNNEFLQPLRKAYHQMKKILGDSYDNVRIYMMAKHGLERDAQMAFKKSLEADYEDVAQRSAVYKAYKGDMNRIINDSDLEFGRVDFNTWRQRDNALRAKYSPSYMDYRYDKNGIAYDYSGLSALFDGSDFEEAANKLVKDIESKYVAETHDLWDATNAATKKILRDGYKAGMMSKDTYQYVRDMYSYYIPLRGWDGTTADQVWDYIGGGKGAFNQTLKKAHGRTSIADDPIAYIENMAESGILLNNKNWVKQHLMLLAQNHPTSLLTLSKAWYVKSVDDNGNEEWIPATPQITSQMDSNQVKAAIDAFEKKMQKMAQTGDATQKRDGLNIAYPQTHSEEREHEVRVMKDGEEYVIYVNGDPQLVQAMNNTRAHRVREIQSGKLDRAAAWLGRKMAAAYTSLSPLFIPSNYFRDMTMTLASTAIREDGRYNYLLRKNLATSWNLGFMLRDYQNGKLKDKVNNGNATPKEQMFYDFMMNGGETGFVSSLDVEDLKKKFKNDLKDLDRWKANPVKVGHTIMDGIEFLNRAIEDSNRFAVYMTSIQYGRSIDEAVNDAKDVTLNFNRKGTGEYGWQMIRNLYLFINPAVQSLQTLGALAKHHPFKFTAVTASWLASGVLVPIVNAALMSLFGGDDDKDKYWQFSKWDRRNNFIMWVPTTHEFVKIPLAQEFRAFYGVGDMIASKMMGGELAEESWGQYAEDLLGQVVDMLPLDPTGYDGNIAVSLMPNAIRPVFELAFNVDFTGKPLFKDTEYNKYDPNFTKAYVGTPDWLVRASRMMNSIGNDYPDVQQNKWDALGDPRYSLNNPAVVDHVLSSYFGGAYTMGSQVLGVLTKSLNDPKEIKVADIPLFSKFVSNPDDRPVTKKQGDEFWSMKENHDRAANTLSKLKKQAKVDGDYSMLERFYGSEEYKQYKQDDVKVKKYEEDKKKERAEESGEEYRPHKLNAEDIYKAHATPKDDFEDLKLKQLFTKLNGFKTSYDLLVDTAPSQSDGYYNINKAAIDAIDVISLDKQEISELKKGFLDDGKDAYNAEDMKQIRDLRKKILSVLEKANKVVVANQKAKAEK